MIESVKSKKFFDSINFAILGIIYAIRHERNVKLHFLIAIGVLLLSIWLNINKIQLMLLFFAITLVILAEMFNTSIEAIVNLLTLSRHPLAKVAKDVAAGGVLLTVITALAIGYLVFYDAFQTFTEKVYVKIKTMELHVIVISLLLVMILVIIAKTLKGRGTPLRGGVVSGHTAIAFAVTTAILWKTSDFLATSLAFFLSLMVAHSRLEARIHKWWEVLAGALLGILATLAIFNFFT